VEPAPQQRKPRAQGGAPGGTNAFSFDLLSYRFIRKLQHGNLGPNAEAAGVAYEAKAAVYIQVVFTLLV
jgi:hypothetical protein